MEEEEEKAAAGAAATWNNPIHHQTNTRPWSASTTPSLTGKYTTSPVAIGHKSLSLP